MDGLKKSSVKEKNDVSCVRGGISTKTPIGGECRGLGRSKKERKQVIFKKLQDNRHLCAETRSRRRGGGSEGPWGEKCPGRGDATDYEEGRVSTDRERGIFRTFRRIYGRQSESAGKREKRGRPSRTNQNGPFTEKKTGAKRGRIHEGKVEKI